jgi:hypothetical protein
LLFILLFLTLAGCGLIGRSDGLDSPEPDEFDMSVEEALETTPLDSRPTVIEELGPPDAFSIKFQELAGQSVRWESWSYFDLGAQFDFIDGELLWSVELEPVADGSIYAHWYDPLEFQARMTAAEIAILFPEIDFTEMDLSTLDAEGTRVVAGEQLLLGFQDDELVYVETFILSPDPDGEPLVGLPAETEQEEPSPEPTSPPTLEPTLEPTPEPTEAQLVLFEDNFEGDTALAISLFGEDIMEYGVIDGEGALTSHFPGGVLVAYYQQPEVADFILEVDLRPLGFAAGSMTGILFRSEYPGGGVNYYNMLSILPNEGKISFQVWLGGEWIQDQTRNIPEELIPPFGIYRMKIDCQGDQIRVYLGDELAAEFTSNLIVDPGYFGLTIVSARDPETVLFDNLTITEHP